MTVDKLPEGIYIWCFNKTVRICWKKSFFSSYFKIVHCAFLWYKYFTFNLLKDYFPMVIVFLTTCWFWFGLEHWKLKISEIVRQYSWVGSWIRKWNNVSLNIFFEKYSNIDDICIQLQINRQKNLFLNFFLTYIWIYWYYGNWKQC